MTFSKSPVPLYFQIANSIEAAIGAGEYPRGNYLPTEKEFAKQFGVSVITVRGAMSALIRKGLVERHRGKGTMVIERTVSSVWELGWLNNLITSVLASRLEVVAMRNVRAPSWVAQRFGIQLGDTVHSMKTIRRAVHRGNEPFMVTELYHPREIGMKLKKSDFENQGAEKQLVITTVEERCRLTIESVRQTMSAELADEESCTLLGLDSHKPLLIVTRDYFEPGGKLIQTGRSRYRTDHYEYVLNIARSHGSGASDRVLSSHAQSPEVAKRK